MIEIKFKGRGGQGVVIASEILGRAFFLEGKYPQCFSIFGGERRGAPVIGFLRVDEKPILLKCQIYRPDQMVIFDFSLVDDREVLRELKPSGLVLINTNEGADSFKTFRRFKMGLISAGEIARHAGLEDTFNTAMLGAYVRLTNLVNLATMIEAIRIMVPSKVEANIEAAHEAYQQIKIYEAEGVGLT